MCNFCRNFFLYPYIILLVTPPILEEPINPCQPSPCGPNANCNAIGETASCSCMSDFVGHPPNCKPECVSNAECASNLACISQKCKDPCPGVCATNAECTVVSHSAICICQNGYTGNPFSYCEIQKQVEKDDINPCNPSPCGANAECKRLNEAGACQCLADFFGDPYQGCRPECVLNSDCSSNTACIRNKCEDPCPGTCGQNAECYVRNHLPTCNCLGGYNGNPYQICSLDRQRKLLCYNIFCCKSY